MNNFPIEYKDKTYWVSRSIAVAIFVYNPLKKAVLAVKRGEGCPDNIGKWCCPCGYLDYNETVMQAAYRELHEETGTNADDVSELQLFKINDEPSDEKQNVTFIYKCIHYNIENNLTTEFSEPNEIQEIKWIPIKDIDNYDWAFNHNLIIKELN